ncbi:MAG: hypothetical protein COA97_03315 [Flavobacteriales bacterium]|nr:MAG: hypothetical protein COA97_03315 [Flavobacteriales bacterium]
MNFFLEFISKNKNVIIITFIFCMIYCSISLVNHYNFRTNAGDLGTYNQAIYDYAHFRANYNTVCFDGTKNMLSDHLTLLQLIMSPLFWLFKSYTLLIVQIVSVLFGGIGVYKYIKLISRNEKLSLLALVHFYSIWGVISALGWDYHDNILGAMFVPWFIYFLRKENYLWASVCIAAVIMSKENLILWAGFIAFGLLLVNFKNKTKRYYLIGLTLFSFFFFFLAINVIIPSFSYFPNMKYGHFAYSTLGDNAYEAIVHIFKHPIKTAEAFFLNHSTNQGAIGVKNEFFITFLLSGGVVLLRKPQYLIVLLPILGQKLFSDIYPQWGLSSQYSIELAPIISIALFEFFAQIKRKKILILAIISVVICGTINIIKIEKRLPNWFNNIQIRFYAMEHYKTPYNKKEIRKWLNQIPSEAKVSAEFNLVPHLAARQYIFEYPRVYHADYVVLCPRDDVSYPLTTKEYKLRIKELTKSKEWETLVNNKDVILFKRNWDLLPEGEIKIIETELRKQINKVDFFKHQAKTQRKTIDEIYRNNAITLYDKRKQQKNNVEEETEISKLIKQIKSNKKWLDEVKRHATERKIPLETMLKRAAIFHSQKHK